MKSINILDEIREPIIRVNKLVSEAILNGEFKEIKRSQHTIDIDCLDHRISIWNANSAEHTAIYEINGETVTNFPFTEGRKVREKLNELTPDQKKRKQELKIQRVKAEMKELGLCPEGN